MMRALFALMGVSPFLVFVFFITTPGYTRFAFYARIPMPPRIVNGAPFACRSPDFLAYSLQQPLQGRAVNRVPE